MWIVTKGFHRIKRSNRIIFRMSWAEYVDKDVSMVGLFKVKVTKCENPQINETQYIEGKYLKMEGMRNQRKLIPILFFEHVASSCTLLNIYISFMPSICHDFRKILVIIRWIWASLPIRKVFFELVYRYVNKLNNSFMNETRRNKELRNNTEKPCFEVGWVYSHSDVHEHGLHCVFARSVSRNSIFNLP